MVLFRAMGVREKYLRRNKDRSAVVKCSSSTKITINPNQVVEVIGHTDKELDFPATAAILHESELSQVSTSIDVTPTAIHYTGQKHSTVKITLSNLTTHLVTIQAKSILCEMQPVQIAEEVFAKMETDNKHDEIIDGLNVEPPR